MDPALGPPPKSSRDAPPKNESIMRDFFARFHMLGAHADKNVIDDLCRFSKLNAHQGFHITQAIVSRFMDRNISVTFKLPILYLMDAVMKYAIGHYPFMFSRYMEDICLRVLQDLGDREKGKCQFLIQTWSERGLMVPEVLAKCKQIMSAYVPPPAMQQHGHPQQLQPGMPIAPNYHHQHQQQQQQQQQHIAYPAYGQSHMPMMQAPYGNMPPMPPHHGMGMTPGPPMLQIPGQGNIYGNVPPPSYPNQMMSIPPPTFQSNVAPPMPPMSLEALVEKEKNKLLGELLTGLGDGANISLNELQVQDPALYEQITTNATATAHQKYNQRNGTSNDLNGMAKGVRFADDIDNTIMNAKIRRKREAMAIPVEKRYLSVWGEKHEAKDKENRHFIRGYIAKEPVMVNVKSSTALMERLNKLHESLLSQSKSTTKRRKIKKENDDMPEGQNGAGSIPKSVLENSSNKFHQAVQTVQLRLASLLIDVKDSLSSSTSGHDKQNNSLPSLLFGPLPLQPSKYYTQGLSKFKEDEEAEMAKLQPQRAVIKREVPPFKVQDLALPAMYALRALYVDQSFAFGEEGMRFHTQQRLDDFFNLYAMKNKIELQVSNAQVMIRRTWFNNEKEWVEEDCKTSRQKKLDHKADLVAAANDDGYLPGMTSGSPRGKEGEAKETNADTGKEEDEQDWMVIADDFFPRCPVSKEVFATEFDADEGEILYKQAVKVFVTALADVNIFKMGQETSHPGVKYVIVHKALVLDSWIESGKVATLKDTIQRYNAMGSAYQETVTALQTAGAEEEDGKIYALLELNH